MPIGDGAEAGGGAEAEGGAVGGVVEHGHLDARTWRVDELCDAAASLCPSSSALPSQGPSSTPMSMQNQFVCFYLYLCYSYSIYVFLFAESVVECIERPSSGPELAGDPVANLAPHLTVSDL